MAETSQAQGNGRFDAKDAGMLLALLLVAVIALWPILCAAPAQAPGLPGQDGRTQWYPWRALAADSLRQRLSAAVEPVRALRRAVPGELPIRAVLSAELHLRRRADRRRRARQHPVPRLALDDLRLPARAEGGRRSRRRGGGRDGVRTLRRAAPESSRRALGRLVRDPVAGADFSLHRMDHAPPEPRPHCSSARSPWRCRS